MTENELTQLRQECWDQALHCFGTATILEARASLFRRRLRIISFVGLALPLSVGATVLAYGLDSRVASLLVWLTGSLSVAQTAATLWSLVFRWDDEFAYSTESLSANRSLADRFRDLAKRGADSAESMRRAMESLLTENAGRVAIDEKHSISENEKRFGMRAALRQFQRACVTCGRVPESLSPTSCPTCGQFCLPRI